MADRRIYPDDAAERLKKHAGQPYRPSNGTEGEIFQTVWCAGCRRERTPEGNGCLIELSAWAYDIGMEGYPAEFVYGADGQPVCRAFEDKNEPPRCAATADLFSEEATHG